jgi:membrane protease YdiL (CAAX protease family)
MTDQPDTTTPDLPLDGKWERGGRSVAAAALFGLLGIGMVYFNVQGILVALVMIPVQMSAGAAGLSGSFFERLSQLMELLAGPVRVVVVITQYLFMLAPALWLVRRWHSSAVWTYIRLAPCPPREIALAVLATLAIIPGGNYIANELTRQLNIPEELAGIGSEIFTAHSMPEFLWLVFVVAITPAIAEEVFFRGYVQRTFERTMGWKSILFVGFVFGLFHLQPLGLITLSLLGIVFGYFYYRSKSLLPSMAAHFANNALVVYLLYERPVVGGVDLAGAEQIPVAWVLATIPIGVVLLVLYHLSTRRNHAGVADLRSDSGDHTSRQSTHT